MVSLAAKREAVYWNSDQYRSMSALLNCIGSVLVCKITLQTVNRHNPSERPLSMSAAELTTLLLFCTAMSFSPGPNTTLSTALAANLGLKGALHFCLAVPAGWALLMLASGLGLGALITGVPALRWAVTLLGVAYMLWLAWKLSRAGQLTAVDTTRLNVTFWQGVGLQFVNIKAWMLALTLSAGWVVNAAGQPAPNPGERLAIICGVMMAFAFTSNFAYALLGSLLRQWLAQGTRLLWFNRALAIVLVITAIWMLML